MATKNPCSCIRSTFDFQLDVINKTKIVFRDLSDWIIDEGYVEPDAYELTVMSPNGMTYVFPLNIAEGGVLDLDAEGAQFSDGIHGFSVSSCGVNYTRTALVTPHLDCCLRKATISRPDKEEEIRDLKYKLAMAKISAQVGNEIEASKALNIVRRELESLKCDCDC